MIDTNKLRDFVAKLEEDQVNIILDQFISSKPNSDDTWQVVEAFQQGMETVGEHFEIGRYCTGDLIFAGILLDASIEKLKPLLGTRKKGCLGTVIIGTVEGDFHDIGKNIMKSLTEIAGFVVEDLGVNQKPQAFVEAVRNLHPQILALSGVLTIAIPSMKQTIDAITEAGLRDNLKIIIGGNAVDEFACQFTGADAWNRNAAEAVKVYKTWSPLVNSSSA